ncbi:hypothetical protein ACFVU0_34495 [Streptomyces sp. NPDC058122]|uniref:hypothetical protein n=1 Tax=Streptomyces sp. NPDC058122 TaxID=3346349 RepID=UPI0036E13B01
MPDAPATADPIDIPARQPLPGTRLIAYRIPAWGIEGPYIHMDAADIHARYAQTTGRAGDFPARTAQFGRDTDGEGLDRFLRGNLNFWRLSEARMTDDGVIRYRQTRNHSTTTFTPDKTSGILINRPDEQVTAPAYRVTGPAGIPQLWRGRAVRDAVARCRRKPVVGWPAGWAHLMPDASVRFDPGGFPWSTPDVYTAEPAAEPESWGPPCAECKYPDSEHDLSRLWPRSRADGSGHTCWTYTRPQT